MLLPLNWVLMQRPEYATELDALVETCAERDVAVQTIKSVARRRWAEGYDGPRRSWYEPLPPGPALERAVAYVMARPNVFLNTSSDATLLDAIVAAADARQGAPTDDELAADVAEHDMSALFDGRELERI